MADVMEKSSVLEAAVPTMGDPRPTQPLQQEVQLQQQPLPQQQQQQQNQQQQQPPQQQQQQQTQQLKVEPAQAARAGHEQKGEGQ
ncbi:hypothetical protein ACLKA7_008066 [Drosophila subpalustris]